MAAKKTPPRPAPPASHQDAVERALAVSGLSLDELARRLSLAPATLERIRRGYQPARAASLSVLNEIISAGESERGEGPEIDLTRLRELVTYLAKNKDLLPQLKLLLDRQDLR